jgi:hypothetical protein
MRDPKEWATELIQGYSTDDYGRLSPNDIEPLIREAQEDGAREWKNQCIVEAQDVAALTERAERAEEQRDDAANRAMQAVESLNANVMARRNAHPRGCCDWSCDLCAPLLELDEKGNG